MKLKVNDIHYTTKYQPQTCIGCIFEENGSWACEEIHLLNDICISKDIIYIESQIIEVLNL